MDLLKYRGPINRIARAGYSIRNNNPSDKDDFACEISGEGLEIIVREASPIKVTVKLNGHLQHEEIFPERTGRFPALNYIEMIVLNYHRKQEEYRYARNRLAA